MNDIQYLEVFPHHDLAKRSSGPPKNAVPFMGYPRQHPSDKNKLILIYDPLGVKPAIMEFKAEDILYAEDVPQAVTEAGEALPLARLYVRQGAHGMLLEPFEVQNPIQFLNKAHLYGSRA